MTAVRMPAGDAILAITLDLDDTLWPVRPTLVAAEEKLARWMRERVPATARAFGFEERRRLREQVLREHPDRAHDVSFMRRAVLHRALAEAGDDPGLAEEGFATFLEARQRVQPYDDVEAVLARWARRYRLVAVTNGNADIARIACGRHFSAAISAHEAGCAKPDRRIFAAACEAADASPRNCLHIGDDWELDIQGARAAGMQVAWVRRPEFAGKPLPAGTDAAQATIFDSLAAVDHWLHPGDDTPGRGAAPPPKS